MSAPRWWESRFEGSVTRERLPADLFDALADRARAAGLHVLAEPPAETLPSYRASAAPTQSLHLQQAEAFVGAWDRLHVWQEGTATVRFEGSFHRWTRHLLVAWPVFTLLYVTLLMLCCPTGLAVGIGAAVLLGWCPMLGRHRRLTRLSVERFVQGVVTTAEPVPLPMPSVAAPEPAPVRARAPDAVPVPPADPALAATAKTARDAFVRHVNRSPEDEVEALEAAARRGGRFE